MLLLSMLLLFGINTSHAQQEVPKRSHALSGQSPSQPNVPDTLTIIAVRVAFQQDDNRLTSGDGSFNPSNLPYLDSDEITIDPLPHDSTYFKNHLLFAKNYFEKVSGGQMTVEYRLLPDIYQLPQKMEAYSPTGETFTNEKVADLVHDTWQTVEQQGGFSTTDLDPNKTTFAIFHAGVGRDIELTGTTLDKTPQDIPSLFLGQHSLAELLEDPTFDGFDINGGAFKITSSMVLPRTLSRRGEDVTGQEFVLQLSINGLLCASIASYLGLPDLFNTQTGNSGIGRFGLMDGESFFSYRGLFPPEPSAWEKIYLDWQSPFTITKNTGGNISLPASSLHQNNSIAKYSLSAGEYFLIENRHRDTNNDGVTLTFRQSDGTTQTKSFNNRDEAFVNQTQDFTDVLEPGVVTDVSDFEWSLPGGLDVGPDTTAGTSDDRLLNGGILVWHIDEAVIESELQNQSVNVNPQRRGVDLEEADGAQDIGQAASTDLSRQARGTAFDFWWDGNDASVVTLEGDTLTFYENRFGDDTRPSNRSNSGARSFFELYNFSDNLPTASIRVRARSTSDIQPIILPVDTLADNTTFSNKEANYLASFPLGLSLYKAQADSFLIIPSQESTYALNLNGGSNSVFDFQSGQIQQPYVGNSLILGELPTSNQIELTSWQWDGANWNSSWNIQIEANNAFLSSLNDQTLLLDFTDQRIDISTGSSQTPLQNPQQQSASLGGEFTVLSGNTLTLRPDNQTFALSNSGKRKHTGALQLAENRPGFYYLSDDELIIFEADNFDQPRTIIQNTPYEWPAFTDLNNNGRIDFIYINKETKALEARNLNGALLDHFPIQPPEGAAFVGTPLITTDQADNRTLFLTTQDSLSINILGYASDGNRKDGFPLFVGSISQKGNQPIHPIIDGRTLFAVSHRGELKAWQLNSIYEILWGSRYGNAPYNKVSGNVSTGGSSPPTNSQQILTKSETYNWPNPAEDFTNLRFQTSGAGVVDVKIITTSGKVVFDERYDANGNIPEEHRISTQNWSSGLYFGMITATVNGQKSRKMIKIVVVH